MGNKIVKRVKVNDLTKNNCFVCNEMSYIVELHHLVTISILNKILNEIKITNNIDFEKHFDKINELSEGIWLCPNHHTIYHKLLSKQYVQFGLMIGSSLRKKYIEVFRYAERDYENIIEYLYNINVNKNLIRNIIKDKNRIVQTLNILSEIK